MDIMVRQARLVFSFIVLVQAFQYFGCTFITSFKGDKPRNLKVRVNVNHPELVEQGELVYYAGSPLSGKVYDLYPDGDTLFTVCYVDGRKDGLYLSWFENGRKAEQRTFVGGRRQGTHKGWWPSGKQKFCYQYDNDLLNGQVKEWYSSGQQYKLMNYSDGYELGMQKFWMADGAIQANYEYRNGRKYGLTGVKNCSNVKDSILFN